MNSIWAVLFVAFATILGKWLLFDDDAPSSELDEAQKLRIAKPPAEPKSSTISKSA